MHPRESAKRQRKENTHTPAPPHGVFRNVIVGERERKNTHTKPGTHAGKHTNTHPTPLPSCFRKVIP